MAKVTLDPGHFQNHNAGAVVGYYEGNWTYEYAQILSLRLKARGVDVEITRKSIVDNPSLTARGTLAASNRSDLSYSIHTNGASSSSAHGVSAFYPIKRPEDKAFAQKWGEQVAALMGTYMRGAQYREGKPGQDYYTVIQSAANRNVWHVILMEHGFHSNPAECAWLMKPENQNALADLECNLICEWLGVAKPSCGTDRSDKPILGQKMTSTPGDTLNVRVDGAADKDKLGELPDGSIVDLLSLPKDGWIRIKSGNLEGWVNGTFLKDVPAKPALDRLLKLITPYMRGDDVRTAQERLNTLGYTCGNADGIYGPKSQAAVKAYQSEHGLAADGIIRPKDLGCHVGVGR